MVDRTTGIVLRTRLLTETSLIVHWLTSEAGRIATVARGARRPKSVFRGKLDLFFEADLAIRRSARSELHTLSEVVVTETYSMIRQDWHLLQKGAYAVAWVEQTVETDTPAPEIWAVFRGFLKGLCSSPSSGPLAVVRFELRFLEALGMLPDFSRGPLSAGSIRLAGRMVEGWEEEGGLDPGAEEADWPSLARYLEGFIGHHLGRVPRGRREALGEVPGGGRGATPGLRGG